MSDKPTPTDEYLSDILLRCDAEDAGSKALPPVTTTDVRGLVMAVKIQAETIARLKMLAASRGGRVS